MEERGIAMNKIVEAKTILPLPKLMASFGLGEHAKKSARCPFHDDRRCSFSVWQDDHGRWSFKCHAGCGAGDEINFLELHEKLSRRDAVKRFLDLAGLNGATPPRSTTTFDWQKCVDAFSTVHLERLSEWRGYPVEFCSWLHKCGLVGLYDGCIAFPVYDNGDATMATATGIHAARSPANVSARSLSLELALLIAILRRDEIAVTNNRDR
jgi:hypothetical protein